MPEALDDVAVVGLGVMGANLARNFAHHGFKVAGFDLDAEAGRKLTALDPDAKIRIPADAVDMVKGLDRPRRIVILVNSGKAVDAVINSLDPLLEEGDVIVDAGNSYWGDTDRRDALAATRPWRFVGMGISGGSEGALLGPAMMPGGDPEAWDRLKNVLEAAAARSPSGVCVTHCGKGSAGHFVKTVHNGIEYGDMQLIAETAMLMRAGLGLSANEVADTFSAWNAGDLSSFLIEITADIFRAPDPEKPGQLLVDAIMDAAGQKGTGKWTLEAASEAAIAIPTITAAVDARIVSSRKALRVKAEAAFASKRAPLAGVDRSDLADALYASKIASYTQGFALIQAGSEMRGYGTNLAEVARIWTAGCIIRAVFLDRIRAAFASQPVPELLALAPDFAADLARRLPAWRRVVCAAMSAGYAIPGLAASLAWFDSITTARGSANVIQAQRDFFGSHTYERVDRPGVFVHTDWPRTKR